MLKRQQGAMKGLIVEDQLLSGTYSMKWIKETLNYAVYIFPVYFPD